MHLACRCCRVCPQVIFPLDFEKTEQSERFMKTVEAVIKERPDCIGSHAARDIPSPAQLGSGLAGVCMRASAMVVLRGRVCLCCGKQQLGFCASQP